MRAQSILVSPSSLTFTAIAQGEPPSPQQIAVLSQDGTSIEFAIRLDGGDPATPAPSWISLNATRALTPARLLVSVNPAGLSAGAQGAARVLLTTPAGVLLSSPIAVSLRLNDAAPRLMATSDFLRFTGRAGGAATLQQSLLVWNAGGGGPLSSVQASAEGGQWLRVETGTCARECPIKVSAGVTGLQRGYYRGLVRITSTIGTREVPVTLDMYDRAPILTLGTAGTSFETRQGNGWPETRRIPVFNTGDFGVTWTAEVLRGREWLSIPNSFGGAALGTPGVLPLAVNASTLGAGTYYALVKLTSPEAANSPQYFLAVLRVNAATVPAVPEFSQAGLIFVGQSGAADPPSQPVTMYASTAGAAYQASPMIAAETGASWLSATPSRATVSTASPAQLLVAAATGALAPGVYTGSIVFAIGNAPERALNVTAVVTPPGAEQCIARRAVVVHSALLDSFALRVGVPQALGVRVVNDCGAAVRDGQAIVYFSSPDEAAVTLLPAGDGSFTGTWTPTAVAANMAVTARVSPTDLDAGSATVVGSVAENNAPLLVSGGVVNNLNPVRAAALAPGTIAQVYGQNLAATTGQPPMAGARLPTAASGTTITIGGIDAPLYYVSPGQVNAQVPFELAVNRTYPVVACTADACATPDQISVAAATPGIAAFADGRAIAQDTDFRLVDSTNPARRGDYIVLYLTGMGATNPVTPSGFLSPRNPLAQAATAPQVVIDGRQSEVFFAGLTPDFVGLYQVNVRVPADTAVGSARIVVIQGGVASNEVTLPVR